MIQLVYISIATVPVTSAAVRDLCAQARHNNQRDEITGILATKSGKFLQVLEGPKDVVEEAFLRIVVDTRHRDLLLLSRRVTTRREFGEWEMQHCEDIRHHDDVVEKIAELTRNAPEDIRQAFLDLIAE